MPFHYYTATVNRDTKYEITAAACSCGRDWSVTVCGGTLHHVGAMAIAYPSEQGVMLKTAAAPDHRDDTAAKIFAEMMSERLNCNISVSAGIHIDNASKEEIHLLLENCRQCCEQLLLEIQSGKF